jgi:hypothetical protein
LQHHQPTRKQWFIAEGDYISANPSMMPYGECWGGGGTRSLNSFFEEEHLTRKQYDTQPMQYNTHRMQYDPKTNYSAYGQLIK